MKALYILYDAQCALCRRCRAWLESQPAFVELRFVAFQSGETERRFPGIGRLNPGDQLLVVSEDGLVYKGPHAWIMCLYALREYREWSQRLASPALLPFARRVCELVSANRLSISRLFADGRPGAFKQMLEAESVGDDCVDGGCRVGR
ncbi:MAG TPA: DUF393 domain-containing protein [Chthoniobacteraceae bacterium]|nr:DUF393 domain-containing protein [Chthoniobacteraceae bacterium]